MTTILFYLTIGVTILGLVLILVCGLCACMLSSQISREEEAE